MKKIIVLNTVIIFCSCITGMKIDRTEFRSIDKYFSGTFVNRSFKSQKSNTFKSKIDTKSSLLELFEIPGVDSDSVSLRFDENNTLVLTYDDGFPYRTRRFLGEFKVGGFFEIYLRNKIFDIPRIYTSVDSYRIRIAGTADGCLIVDIYSIDLRMSVFYYGGNTYRYQHYFRPASIGKP